VDAIDQRMAIYRIVFGRLMPGFNSIGLVPNAEDAIDRNHHSKKIALFIRWYSIMRCTVTGIIQMAPKKVKDSILYKNLIIPRGASRRSARQL
jgi:hypothetical protein